MKTIVITGPSGSGKSFLANRLSNDIKNSIIINTDSYYRDNLLIRILSLFMNDIYDRVISIKAKEIIKTINSIYNNEKHITFYTYNFKTKKSSKIIKYGDRKIKFIIVEGVFSHRISLNYKESLNILCKENKSICYQRRLIRDKIERGRKRSEVNKKFNSSWNLFYNNLHSYIETNDVFETNTFDKINYDRLINKLNIKL
tara:strand:- start:10491 stop:11090 length:600 start_codon:yes stop_codon:yes gene_type:complete